MSAEDCRRKAEALLREASQTPNMKERGRLIDEAIRWRSRALDARDQADDWDMDSFNDGAEARA